MTTTNDLSIGDCRITRVPDLEDFAIPADVIYPDATPEAVCAAAARFGPRFVDAATLGLLLSFHSFVVKTPLHTVLVDACIGDHKPRPRYAAWDRKSGPFLARLAAAGVQPGAVDFVMCTHLHADHVGWNTRLENGRWVPTFPNAEYIIAADEYRHYRDLHDTHPAEPVNYGSFADSVLPVVASGQARLVASDFALAPGLYLEPAAGHTPGNVMIHLARDSAHALFSGDVLHHPLQLMHPEWSTRFCFDAARSHAVRRALLARVAGTATLLLTAHFQAPTAGRVVRDGPAFGFEFVGAVSAGNA